MFSVELHASRSICPVNGFSTSNVTLVDTGLEFYVIVPPRSRSDRNNIAFALHAATQLRERGRRRLPTHCLILPSLVSHSTFIYSSNSCHRSDTMRPADSVTIERFACSGSFPLASCRLNSYTPTERGLLTDRDEHFVACGGAGSTAATGIQPG